MTKKSDDGLQLRRAISIKAEGKKFLEKYAVAPSAARLCYAAVEAQPTGEADTLSAAM